jgi:hypothetical protein
MKERASHLAPVATQRIWRDDAAFFHRGTSGQWRDVLEDSDRQRYAARVASLVPADLAAWAHSGRSSDGSWGGVAS